MWLGEPVKRRGLLVAAAALAVANGAGFAFVAQRREMAIPWLLIGLASAVGALLADRRDGR